MKLLLKTLTLVLTLAASAVASPASAWAQDTGGKDDPGSVINVFAQVDPGIFRGARPGDEGLQALSRFGIKTDIDLENTRDVVAHEAGVAEALGMKVISVPLSGFWAPKDEAVTVILNALADPSNYPVFIHCQYGQDRTGLLVGLYRVFHDHWAPADAYHEMLGFGFHKILVGLNHYFEEKTGYED